MSRTRLRALRLVERDGLFGQQPSRPAPQISAHSRGLESLHALEVDPVQQLVVESLP